jgi:mono/diheme cytochrome c family protein
MHTKSILTVALLILFTIIFTAAVKLQGPEKPIPIPPSKQRTGNAEKGYTYLTEGDYVKGGIPYSYFMLATRNSKTDYLKRSGLNANVSHEYTVIKVTNGERLVAPNCLQCHAQVFNDSLYIGMGNTFIDFTIADKLNSASATTLQAMMKKTAPTKYEASKHFFEVSVAIAPYLKAAVKGVNTADRLAAVLAAHRDPATFKWLGKPQLNIPAEVIPSDVPAWWLLKKKNAMFYNGFGRGDFGRFLMASNLLTVTDTSESSKVDDRICDVLAFINTLKPPPFPQTIQSTLAAKGEAIFNNNCAKCHGTYGKKEEYPNLLIPQQIIKTDSALHRSNYQNPQFINWFNNSWFATGDHPARLEPFNGYIAPPLDGIWCTAPYLHNGSVPTVEAVLNSHIRPAYWQRNFDKPEYDYQQLGWKFVKTDSAGANSTIYNTRLKGYGNYGHYFGDKLTDSQRKAVLEYLKTL